MTTTLTEAELLRKEMRDVIAGLCNTPTGLTTYTGFPLGCQARAGHPGPHQTYYDNGDLFYEWVDGQNPMSTFHIRQEATKP